MGTCRLSGLNVLIESEHIARVVALLDLCQASAVLANRVASQLIAVDVLPREIKVQAPFVCLFPGPTPGRPGPTDDLVVIHRVTPDGVNRIDPTKRPVPECCGIGRYRNCCGAKIPELTNGMVRRGRECALDRFVNRLVRQLRQPRRGCRKRSPSAASLAGIKTGCATPSPTRNPS
jgi:hypothetical protein